jgi:hypothetical protein
MLGAPELGVSYRPLLETVASRVVLEASCTVTLVRPRLIRMAPRRVEQTGIAGV